MFIKVNNVIENKDGSGIVDIEVTDELKVFIRNYYKRERCTKKLVSEFVNEGITNYVQRFGLCKK